MSSPVYSGVRMTFYEYIREEWLGKNSDGTIPVWKAIIGGMVAGMTAQFLARYSLGSHDCDFLFVT